MKVRSGEDQGKAMSVVVEVRLGENLVKTSRVKAEVGECWLARIRSVKVVDVESDESQMKVRLDRMKVRLSEDWLKVGLEYRWVG